MSFLTGTALGVAGVSYISIMNLFALTASRRYEHRSGNQLPRLWALIWGLLWPVWSIVWIVSALVLPFEKRPASLIWEPSKANRAAEALDRRRVEREAAVEDWETRAAFWYAEGQRAEREDDQALKWLVAEQLSFLLETRPEQAQTPEERAKSEVDRRAVKLASVNQKIRQHRDPTRSVARAVRKGELVNGSPHWVGYCNVCTRYRQREQLMMEGVCRECSKQQGLG